MSKTLLYNSSTAISTDNLEDEKNKYFIISLLVPSTFLAEQEAVKF